MHRKLLLILMVILTICSGSHFRGAIFSWRPTSHQTEIEISYRVSWRRSAHGHFCDQTTISSGLLLGEGSLDCFVNCTGTIVSLNYGCTDYSEAEDWTTGRGSVKYNFPSAHTYFEFGFQGGDWISLVTGGGRWEFRVKANLSPRADTGRINSSPQTDIAPIVRLIYGCSHTIRIPVYDLDGDDVRCQWASSALNECAGICNAFTGAILTQNSCTLNYNAVGNVGYYGVAIQAEDFAAGGVTPLSSVPIQFIVYVYNSTHSCNNVPEFLPPTRPDQDTIILNPSSSFVDQIVARSRVPNTDIQEITTVSPSGFSKSSLTSHLSISQAWYINVTWNPPLMFSSQTYVYCFSATDKSGLTSEQRCVTIIVKGDVNECDAFPCENGGTCTNTLGSYFCDCTSGWRGKNCSEDINECHSFPCQNNGTCINTYGSYVCHCKTGFTGINCIEDIDECDFSPCENDGNCTNTYGSYICNCTIGWIGKNCSEDVNECDRTPCDNGGTCTNTEGSYFCVCLTGWDGKHCSQDVNECERFPCEHGGCTNTLGSYNCDCQIGWVGKDCSDVQLGFLLPLVLIPLGFLATLAIIVFMQRTQINWKNKVSDFITALSSKAPPEFKATGWKHGYLGASRPAPPIQSKIFSNSLKPEYH